MKRTQPKIQSGIVATTVLFLNISSLALSNAVQIKGWPASERFFETVATDPETIEGDDPLFGRLACPALMRYHAADQKFEGLILDDTVKSVEPQKGQGAAETWHYRLRSGIFWWNGEAVTAEDVAVFLKTRLSAIVERSVGSLWRVPEFSVETRELDIEVHWQSKPEFGPMILAGVSLWRPIKEQRDGATAFECAGHYRLTTVAGGLKLSPTEGYRTPRPEITVTRDTSDQGEVPKVLDFQTAHRIDGSCSRQIQVPWVTGIRWFPDRPPVDRAEFRAMIGELMPREQMVRLAAKGMATPLVSWADMFVGQLPKPKPMSQLQTFHQLRELGYTRKTADALLTDSNHDAISLNLIAQGQKGSMVQTLVADGLKVAGITLHYREDEPTNRKKAHGELIGLMLPWSPLARVVWFHSKGPAQSTARWPSDPKQDEAIAEFARDFTRGMVDRQTGSRLVAALDQRASLTPLLQHSVCANLEGGLRQRTAVNEQDPDWLRLGFLY